MIVLEDAFREIIARKDEHIHTDWGYYADGYDTFKNDRKDSVLQATVYYKIYPY